MASNSAGGVAITGPGALWQSVAAAKSLSAGTLGIVSLLHTVQLISLAVSVLAVADVANSRDANAFLYGLSLAACVLTGSRWEEVFTGGGVITVLVGILVSGAAVAFVFVIMSGLDASTW